MTPHATTRLLAVIALFAGSAGAQSLDEILNYRAYSPAFASAGQPTVGQLEVVRDAGFERIVYLAFSNDRNAIPSADRLVRDLGMDYVHIPVVWDAPTVADYASFSAIMNREPNKKTLLYCQANMRATAFAFLYRVLELGVPIAEAKAAMNSVWEPNPTWRTLIFDVLAANGVSPDCDACDWGD